MSRVAIDDQSPQLWDCCVHNFLSVTTERLRAFLLNPAKSGLNHCRREWWRGTQPPGAVLTPNFWTFDGQVSTDDTCMKHEAVEKTTSNPRWHKTATLTTCATIGGIPLMTLSCLTQHMGEHWQRRVWAAVSHTSADRKSVCSLPRLSSFSLSLKTTLLLHTPQP